MRLKFIILSLAISLQLSEAKSSNELFNSSINFWKNISENNCETSKKDINFPLWVDGTYIKKDKWSDFCNMMQKYQKKASKHYNEKLGNLYYYKSIKVSKDNKTIYSSSFHRFKKLIDSYKSDLEVVLLKWSKDKKVSKKSGITFIYDCKNFKRCKIIGIDDKIITDLIKN